MSKFLCAVVLAGLSLSGCTYYHSVATAPSGKIYVTRTTNYLIFTSNKALLCEGADTVVNNCKEVTINE